jgi:nitric oxide reductase subunit B
MNKGSRRPMVLSPVWMQGMLLTFLIGFAILGYLALQVYEEHAPVPARVVDEAGNELCTSAEIMQGQEAFLTYGLMQFGSVYGHGAYLGPDFTADYLHRQAELMQQYYGGDGDAAERVRRELQANRYDPVSGTLVWSDGQVRAFEALQKRYVEEFLNRKQSGAGLGPHAFPMLMKPAESRLSSPGPRGRPPPAVPTALTRIRTTGRWNRWWTTI